MTAPAVPASIAPGRPGRRWAWQATYRDGTALAEDGADEADTRFDDLAREHLARFSLIDTTTRTEVLGLDCTTGVFTVRGHELRFLWGDLLLTGRTGVRYDDVVQYKSAHTDWRAGTSSGVVVDAHYLGYQAALPEALLKLVLRLDASTMRVTMEGEARLRGPVALQPGDLLVMVDGTRVAGAAELDAALQNPGLARPPLAGVG